MAEVGAALTIRGVAGDDAAALLHNIRPADLAEAEALLGPGAAADALRESIARSAMCWTGETGGEVAFIFGCCPASALGGQGAPWLVGTPLIDTHRRSFTRLSHAYIARMLALFPTLLNLVDARNVKSIAYLRKMGFTVLPAMPTGFAGLPFHPFYMEA